MLCAGLGVLLASGGAVWHEQIGVLLSRWDYTPGWGALATVSLALVAVTINLVGLRRASRQFEQTRLDTQADKLRVEVSELVVALMSRNRKSKLLLDRVQDILSDSTTAGLSRDRMRQRTQAAFAELVDDFYEEALAHCMSILMLTSDAKVVEPVGEILDALSKDRAAWWNVVSTHLNQSEQAVLLDQAKAAASAIDEARERLSVYLLGALSANAIKSLEQ
jgi:hypothetical protein